MGGRGSSSASSKRGAVGEKGHYDVDFKPSKMDSLAKNPHYLYEEAIKFTAGLLGVDEDMAREYNSAVNDFTDRGYARVRKVQRGESVEDWARDSAERKAKLVEEYIDRAPKWSGGTTYRGVSAISIPRVGDVIDMGGTSSWSSSLNEAMFYTNSYGSSNRIVFVSPTQTKGTSIRHLSKFVYEDEVMASSRSQYVVSSINFEGGVAFVHVKEAR